MKTWNIPYVEDLDVKLTAGGEVSSVCEHEVDLGCIEYETHKCCEFFLTGHCPHQNNGDGPVGDGES